MTASTTYDVIYLGLPGIEMDTLEGNPNVENALALSNMTFGSAADPLYLHVQTMAPYGSPAPSTYYRTNNSLYQDQFTLDGGTPQTFDANARFDAVITYDDNTTATVSVVIFQDTSGNTYLAPEVTQDATYQAMIAKPIQSITLGTPTVTNNFGMDVIRETTNFVCFAAGTLIDTADGPRPVETLRPGDMLQTMDHGYQPLRWVGCSTVPAIGPMAPVIFDEGVIGNFRPLTVSQQHRILVDGVKAGCVEGAGEYFIPAKKLTGRAGIAIRNGGQIDYYHLLMDSHEVIFSEGVPTESFYLGRQGWLMLQPHHHKEIHKALPELTIDEDCRPDYGPLARPVGKLSTRKPAVLDEMPAPSLASSCTDSA